MAIIFLMPSGLLSILSRRLSLPGLVGTPLGKIHHVLIRQPQYSGLVRPVPMVQEFLARNLRHIMRLVRALLRMLHHYVLLISMLHLTP